MGLGLLFLVMKICQDKVGRGMQPSSQDARVQLDANADPARQQGWEAWLLSGSSTTNTGETKNSLICSHSPKSQKKFKMVVMGDL